MNFSRLAVFISLFGSTPILAQIPQPADAPKPLSPEETLKSIKLPPGFQIELVASEPLVIEPSQVCWDAKGRMYVSEIHGYNLEGQLDIEEVNKTGKLDREVRRLFADAKTVAAAKRMQYGTIRLLVDSKGDGKYDKSIVFADKLPACYGMVPYKDGIIAIAAPDIIFYADRDGDGKAEVKEVLYTGFNTELMERRINDPHWGLDGWIHVGSGNEAATITGPKLKEPVKLSSGDFRIKPDGTAIEAVTGRTRTIGMAYTEWGDKFVMSTNTPALFTPPVPWHYLSRNPYVSAAVTEVNLSKSQVTYPISKAHPWREQRANDPGFANYYSNRYGKTESQANGYFTSGCSPLVYQDIAIPGLRGNILACEPAQNMIHRGIIERNGSQPNYRRPKEEEKSEFLASSDVWFHPIGLNYAPDGSVIIADFYREIIEDYSAIPRYLQQQYELNHGKDHGRVWKLTHKDAIKAPPADMSNLTTEQLAKEIVSGHQWRRETARRLLWERNEKAAVPALIALLPDAKDTWSIVNIAYTVDGLEGIKASEVEFLLNHEKPEIRVHGLRFADRFVNSNENIRKKVLAMVAEEDEGVRLQLALTIGECKDASALPVLMKLAREHNDEKWMSPALLSSFADRNGVVLEELLASPNTIGKAGSLIEPLCSSVAARKDAKELSNAITRIAGLKDQNLQKTCLKGLQNALKTQVTVALSEDAKRGLKELATSRDADLRGKANALVIVLKLEDSAKRKERLAGALQKINDFKAPNEERLIAVAQLAGEDDAEIASILFNAIPYSTPSVRDAIIDAFYARQERHKDILTAIEKKQIAPSILSALQRVALLESKDVSIRERAAKLLKSTGGADQATFKRYTEALASKRDVARGGKLFQEKCGICHQAHGVGVAVGPNLSSEFQRAEETIIRDILAPNDVISAGYTAYAVSTLDGQNYTGILAVESASSITLRGSEGKETVVLRKDIDSMKTVPVSLMPEDLPKTLTPQDVADIIAWVRNPPSSVVLIDEDRVIANILKEGGGKATFVTNEKFSGEVALQITSGGKAAKKIKGWEYKIRENPGVGEFRYLRLAWKVKGDGTMLELATEGEWPPLRHPIKRYYTGKNTTKMEAKLLPDSVPKEWTVVTFDLWKEWGDMTLTGLAFLPMGDRSSVGWFDKVELLRSIDEEKPPEKK